MARTSHFFISECSLQRQLPRLYSAYLQHGNPSTLVVYKEHDMEAQSGCIIAPRSPVCSRLHSFTYSTGFIYIQHGVSTFFPRPSPRELKYVANSPLGQYDWQNKSPLELSTSITFSRGPPVTTRVNAPRGVTILQVKKDKKKRPRGVYHDTGACSEKNISGLLPPWGDTKTQEKRHTPLKRGAIQKSRKGRPIPHTRTQQQQGSSRCWSLLSLSLLLLMLLTHR